MVIYFMKIRCLRALLGLYVISCLIYFAAVVARNGSVFVGEAFAAPSEQGLEHGKGHDQGKKLGHDKDRGPSVPALPMAAAVLIGICAAGGGAYYFSKKSNKDKDAN